MSKVEDFVAAQKLLDTKKKKTKPKVCLDELNKIWVSFPNSDENEVKSSIQNCTSKNSQWVLRKTPTVFSDYKIGNVLGHPGQYGTVKLASSILDPSKQLAIKIINKNRFQSDPKKRSEYFSDIRSEVYLVCHTSDHPNIIEIHSVYEDTVNVYIIMSICDGGELFDRIQEDDCFSESKASKLFKQMMHATYYLHSLGIAHCDLKPENFLFRNKRKDSNLCLIDFGMAKLVKFGRYYSRMNGTPYYIAPEVLDGKYNESCDIWSLGVILFIMIFGFPPFFDENESNHTREESDKVIYKRIKKGFKAKVRENYGAWFPKQHPVSDLCRDLISRLLRVNVADRMTAEEALEHPWLKTNDNDTPLLRVMNPTILHSIRGYKAHSALQKEILKLLNHCNYLNEAQSKSVQEFFTIADTDGDGKISGDELYQALKQIDSDVTKSDVESILMSVDANNDGYMDFDELLSSRINRKLQSKEERLRKVFAALDLDNSGTLSPDEIRAALQTTNLNISLTECNELMKDVDVNNDGEIDFNEFIQMFKAE